MSERFDTILTNAGLAAIANASITQKQVNFAKLGVGDSNGAYYTPTQEATALRNQVWIGNASSVTTDPNNPNWIVVKAVIPGTVGGFEIREIGIFDENNVLLAIGKLPVTYKPIFSEGSTKELTIKAIFEVTNTSAVTLKIDTSVIYASEKYVDEKVQIVSGNLNTLQKSVTEHVSDISQHTYHALDTGTANAKVVTIPTALASYVAGLTIRLENKVLNTGAVTINVNGLGVKNVVKSDGSAINSGDMKAGGVYTISYSGALGNFTLQGSGGGVSTPAYWGNGADGLLDTDTSTRTWLKSPSNTIQSVEPSTPIGTTLWTWTANKAVGVDQFKFRYYKEYGYLSISLAVESSMDNNNWTRHMTFDASSNSNNMVCNMNNIYCKYIRIVLARKDGSTVGTKVTLDTDSVVETPTIRRFADTYSGACIKQYTDFTLPSGHILGTYGAVNGLVIMSQGDITLNGTIDMNQKGGDSAVSYPLSKVFPSHPSSNIHEVLGVIGELKAGHGGNGGYGGGTTNTYGNLRATGGNGDVNPTTCGGFGGGGGGGAINHAPGGNGGSAGKSYVDSYGPEYMIANKGSSYGVNGMLSRGGNGSASDASSVDYSPRSYAKQGPGGLSRGAGGGGGGGAITDTTNNNGADGGAGGVGQGAGGFVLLIAKGKITMGSGSRIEVQGGAGGNGGSANSYGTYTIGASGGGGGGGAGGGTVLLLYGDSYSNNGGGFSLSGGTGGSGGYPVNSSSSPGIEYGGSGTSGTAGQFLVRKVGT
ncbi:phage tail protein [Lysinibacillus sp. NPDC093692]|uniref:phage tail protein n=1 Tax=Lysinibacillus sp. NPDC093692 TaxID=3390578 RepID=UPI003CFEBBB2